jgi:NAD(P)-dependent dehydrogenase (short-subunit alcohol dehydrogenase family)
MLGTLEGRVTGRVAVITGASRGLGAGLAARFAEHGVRLGLCARHEPARPDGADGVVTAAVDVTDAQAVDRFASEVADRLGPIDLWINNAGLLEPIAPLRDAEPAQLEAHVRTNVLGVLYGSRAYVRHVRHVPRTNGGGVLVNITSGAATSVYEGWSAYCATKAAVDQATRVIAAEEADAGLRAYAVSPGVVDTDMQATIRATSPEAFPQVERFRKMAETGAFNKPSSVADHILAAAFDPAAEPPDIVWRVPADY